MRAFRIAYDGRDYHGFQRQPAVATVSDTILAALRALDVLQEGADVPPGYAAAGRTDAGVSARAQTVAFAAPEWLTPRALNGELPEDVSAWASADAPADFHATHDAAAREYTYYWYAPVGEEVDDDAARTAMDRLAGEHDFHNLTPDETGTIRTLSTSLARDGPFLALTFRADGFPRQFVRRAVSVVRSVATGVAETHRIDRVLGPEPLDGPAGVAPAPAEPLVLTGVDYPELAFAVDDAGQEATWKTFERLRVDRVTAARVARRIADR